MIYIHGTTKGARTAMDKDGNSENEAMLRILHKRQGQDYDEVMEVYNLYQGNKQQHKEDCWLTIPEAMAYARMSRSSIVRLIRDYRQLKAIKLSAARCGKVLVSRASLEALLETKHIIKTEK